METFIKDHKILSETESEEDLFDFSSQFASLEKKLINITESSIVGYVGKYGSGKSSLIKQVEKYKDSFLNKNTKWIHFDAWMFPEKKELWEGLILKTAKDLGKLSKALKEIEGKKHDDVKLGINTAVDIAEFVIPGSNFGFIKNLNHFVETSPATRVFQLQDIFKDLIGAIKENTVIFVLEDLDRSGEEGFFFLETLKLYLRDVELKGKKILAIVPVAEEEFFDPIKQNTTLKCFDYVEFHSIRQTNFRKFMGRLLDDSLSGHIDFISQYFEYLYLSQGYSIRKVKLILRQAENLYKRLLSLGYTKVDWRICIIVESMKYVTGNEFINLHERTKRLEKLEGGSIYSHALVYISAKKLELFPGDDYSSVPNSLPVKLFPPVDPAFNDQMEVKYALHVFDDADRAYFMSKAYFF